MIRSASSSPPSSLTSFEPIASARDLPEVGSSSVASSPRQTSVKQSEERQHSVEFMAAQEWLQHMTERNCPADVQLKEAKKLSFMFFLYYRHQILCSDSLYGLFRQKKNFSLWNEIIGETPAFGNDIQRELSRIQLESDLEPSEMPGGYFGGCALQALNVEDYFSLLYKIIDAMPKCSNEAGKVLNDIVRRRLTDTSSYTSSNWRNNGDHSWTTPKTSFNKGDIGKTMSIPEDATVTLTAEEKALHGKLKQAVAEIAAAVDFPETSVPINQLERRQTTIDEAMQRLGKATKGLRKEFVQHQSNLHQSNLLDSFVSDVKFELLRHCICNEKLEEAKRLFTMFCGYSSESENKLQALSVEEHISLLGKMIGAMPSCDTKTGKDLNDIVRNRLTDMRSDTSDDSGYIQLNTSGGVIHFRRNTSETFFNKESISKTRWIPEDATVTLTAEEKALHGKLKQAVAEIAAAVDFPETSVPFKQLEERQTKIDEAMERLGKATEGLKSELPRHQSKWLNSFVSDAKFKLLRHYIRDGASATETSRNIDEDTHFKNASFIQCLIEGLDSYQKEHSYSRHVFFCDEDVVYSESMLKIVGNAKQVATSAQRVRLIPDLLEAASKMDNRAHVSAGMLTMPIKRTLEAPFYVIGATIGVLKGHGKKERSDIKKTYHKTKEPYRPNKNQGMLLKLAIRQFDQVEHIVDKEEKKAALKDMFEGLIKFANERRQPAQSKWAEELMNIAIGYSFNTPAAMRACVSDDKELSDLQNTLKRAIWGQKSSAPPPSSGV